MLSVKFFVEFELGCICPESSSFGLELGYSARQ